MKYRILLLSFFVQCGSAFAADFPTPKNEDPMSKILVALAKLEKDPLSFPEAVTDLSDALGAQNEIPGIEPSGVANSSANQDLLNQNTEPKQ